MSNWVSNTNDNIDNNESLQAIINEKFHAAVSSNSVEMVMEYLAMGADVRCQDLYGDTAVHTALLQGHYKLLDLLIGKYGADVNAINIDGHSLFVKACVSDDLDALKILIKNGVNLGMDSTQNSPLHWCIRYKSKNICKYLLDTHHDTIAIYVNVTDGATNSTALHYACRKGNLELVKLLCNHNDIDLNALDGSGDTAFLIACTGNTEIVRFLIERGCDINQLDKNNKTALDRACENNSLENVKLIFKHPNLIKTKCNANTSLYLADNCFDELLSEYDLDYI